MLYNLINYKIKYKNTQDHRVANLKNRIKIYKLLIKINQEIYLPQQQKIHLLSQKNKGSITSGEQYLSQKNHSRYCLQHYKIFIYLLTIQEQFVFIYGLSQIIYLLDTKIAMDFLAIITFAILSLIALILIWLILIKGLIVYWRARFALGAKNVIFIYKPFKATTTVIQENTKLHGNSYYHFYVELKKNPTAKLIVYTTLFITRIVLLDFNMIKNFTIKNQENIGRPKAIIFQKRILRGILFSDGAEWKKSRKLLSQLFHFDILKSRETIFKSIIDKTIVDLEKKQIDLFKIGKTIAGRGVIDSLFGKRFSEIRFGDNDPAQQIQYIMNQSVELTSQLFYILRFLFAGPINNQEQCFTASQRELYHRIIRFKTKCHEYLEQEYERFQKGQQLSQFLITFFNLKDKQQDIYDAMIQQLVILVFAGQDTTSTAIVICLYQLAQNPEIQQSLRKQLKQNEDIYSCKELTNFIYESMRMSTPVFFSLMRSVVSDFELVPGYILKKNQLAIVGIGVNMMNPYYFDEPEVFNPARFNKNIQNNLSFIPFYTGMRNCLGQHMAMIQVRLTIKKILQNYKLSRTSTEFKTKTMRLILNKPIETTLVKFEKLN